MASRPRAIWCGSLTYMPHSRHTGGRASNETSLWGDHSLNLDGPLTLTRSAFRPSFEQHSSPIVGLAAARRNGTTQVGRSSSRLRGEQHCGDRSRLGHCALGETRW
eukprot:3931756-Rhodomonas_salina.3